MKEKKIKVSVPSENPHICYIPGDRKEKISCIKKVYELSLYKILCIVAHKELSSKKSISEFKSKLKKQGWKNIGEWATALVDSLYDCNQISDKVDLSSFEVAYDLCH